MSLNLVGASTQYVTLTAASGSGRVFSGDFLIGVWFTCTDASQDTQFRVIWNNGGSSAAADYMQVNIIATGVLWFLTADTERIIGTTAVNDGVWRYLTVRRIGTSITMELNGVQEGSAFSSSTDYTHSLVKFYIGVYSGEATGRWVGKVSEFGIWSTTLNNNDISNLISKVKRVPLQIKPASLKVYLPMDDFPNNLAATGASSIRDLSSRADHGTPVNSPLGVSEQVLSYV